MRINGVISNWSYLDGRIYGNCVMHDKYNAGIEAGESIITSAVKKIYSVENRRYVKTQNSTYLLID